MADQTPIEWTDATWNIITGCSVVSPGCTNCYAMKLAGTRLQHHPSRAGLTIDSKAGPVWNGQVRFNAEWLTQPLRWTKPRMIFVCAHGDLFHEGVPDYWLDQIFAVMALAHWHTFQVLTKRPERMRAYLAGSDLAERLARAIIRQQDDIEGAAPAEKAAYQWQLDPATIEAAAEASYGFGPAVVRPWPLPNVWLGVSVEDQARADVRIPILLDTPAAVRWISAEPLLGPVDLQAAWHGEDALNSECWGDCGWCKAGHPPLHNCQRGKGDWEKGRSGLDWVVAGGESGPGARPMHPDWARQLRDQCAEAGVPFLFKQWGEWMPVTVEGDPEWDTIDEGIAPATAQVLTPRETCLLYSDGRRQDDKGLAFQTADPRQMLRLGKKAAGRHLDGQLHDGFATTAEARG